MPGCSIIVFSVSNTNIGFYQKSLSTIECELFQLYSVVDYERTLSKQYAQLAIIDLELGSTDAITVIKETKSLKKGAKPFIVVCSDKNDDFIQISAFNSGADDFVHLPQSHLVFSAKINSIVKRALRQDTQLTPTQNSFLVDRERYKIVVGTSNYSLPRLEFRLVDLLFSNPGKIFSKDEIAARIWQNKEISSKRIIDIHIRNIRRVLGDDVIKTYRGIGYCIKPFK